MARSGLVAMAEKLPWRNGSNGRTQISWLQHDGREGALAQRQQMATCKLVGFGAMAAQWPSANIAIELGCLGVMAVDGHARESTIKLVALARWQRKNQQ
jgi:hypothetical protein